MLTMMDAAQEESLVLRLTIEHLLANDEWPELRDLHRRIYRELNEQLDVKEVARRLASPSAFSRFHDLGDHFVPPLRDLGRVREGTTLIDVVVAFIDYALTQYLSSDGDVEVTETEVIVELGLDARVVKVLPRLIDGVPFISNGRTTRDGLWAITISDEITRLRDVHSKEDLAAFLEWADEERKHESAALADAHYRMVSAGRGAYGDVYVPTASQKEVEDHRTRTWFESHPIQATTLVAAILGGIAAAIAIGKALG